MVSVALPAMASYPSCPKHITPHQLYVQVSVRPPHAGHGGVAPWLESGSAVLIIRGGR